VPGEHKRGACDVPINASPGRTLVQEELPRTEYVPTKQAIGDVDVPLQANPAGHEEQDGDPRRE
jgi:hypothetical protein